MYHDVENFAIEYFHVKLLMVFLSSNYSMILRLKFVALHTKQLHSILCALYLVM